MTPVALPPLTPAAAAAAVGGSSTALAQLVAGQVVSGLVLALIDETTLRLQTPAGVIDVKANAALAPGTPVSIAVKGTPQQPEFSITPVAAVSRQASDQVADAVRLDSAEPVLADNPSETAASTAHTDTADIAEQSGARAPSTPAPLMQTALSSAAAIVRNAATSQGGLAALYANLEAVAREPWPSIPVPVLAAARQLVAMRLDLASGRDVGADDIAAALTRSGLMIGSGDGGTATKTTDASTLGTALIMLRQALKSWLEAEPEAASPSGPASAREPPTTSPASRPAAPMPPFRGAPTVAQAPSAPSMSSHSGPRQQAVELLAQTDAAIARQILLRIASLPENPTTTAGHDQANATRLTFDIPLATAHGTGVAQMTVERDGSGRRRGDSEPGWRASFSIDLESIGPVHVRIALAGERTSVTLNAERPDSAALLSAGLPLLEAGLRGADLEPGALRCQSGMPRAPAAGPGLFVDHAS